MYKYLKYLIKLPIKIKQMKNVICFALFLSLISALFAQNIHRANSKKGNYFLHRPVVSNSETETQKHKKSKDIYSNINSGENANEFSLRNLQDNNDNSNTDPNNAENENIVEKEKI